MWPPIEAGPPKQLFGLPIVIWWGILTGCFIVLLIALIILFLICWFLPRRRRKLLNLTQDSIRNGIPVVNNADNTGEYFGKNMSFFENGKKPKKTCKKHI